MPSKNVNKKTALFISGARLKLLNKFWCHGEFCQFTSLVCFKPNPVVRRTPLVWTHCSLTQTHPEYRSRYQVLCSGTSDILAIQSFKRNWRRVLYKRCTTFTQTGCRGSPSGLFTIYRYRRAKRKQEYKSLMPCMKVSGLR